ncbi:MAG: type VI secretion system baseplate subunit TssF [Pirellulaceae bacterium]|nr:type VI secretion system baseplate subunit TssF [Pirellulaceae bacterium]
MDPRLLDFYERELKHLREVGGEFAAEFPKIAGRLGLDGFECADPYVERLLEGFAFLAARVHLKIDAEFPYFTQHLLEMVYPHYLAPIPSMAVVRFQADLKEGSLAEGFTIPRGTLLRSQLGKGEQTACQYSTSRDATLWPLELVEAEYVSKDVAAANLPPLKGVNAGLRIRLRSTAGLKFNELPSLDSLPVFLHGTGELPMHLYEALLANCAALVIRPREDPRRQLILHKANVRATGFGDHEALLPYGSRSFHGYRLLQEYFAFPQRFMFVELVGFRHAIDAWNRGPKKLEVGEVDVLVLLDQNDRYLESNVSASDLALFCSPAINLFPKRTDRIHLDDRTPEYHVVPDRTRPLDFEVYQIRSVQGLGTSAEQEQEFLPFYCTNDLTDYNEHNAFYTISRAPRVLSSKQKVFGPRSSYVGCEVFLSLVNRRLGPYQQQLKQLAVETLCTNRDLPIQMPVGKGRTDFTMEAAAPVNAIHVLAGPTRPRPSPTYAPGDVSWRLISHLALNYLTLTDTDERQGAAALRELLSLYADTSEPAIRKQVEGVRSVRSRPIVRPLPTDGPRAFGRGLEILLTFDEGAFEGTGMFLLGAVMEQFFARYVTINSFTETVVSSTDRGEVIRWPARIGQRHLL